MKKGVLILSGILLMSLCSCAPKTTNSNGDHNSTPGSVGPNSIVPPSIERPNSTPLVDTDENNKENSTSIPSPSTTPDTNYDSKNETSILLKDNASVVSNNNGGVVVDENDIYITKAGLYRIEGTLSNGKIIVNPESEDEVVEIDLAGVDITCNYGAPIGIFNGDKVEISAKSGTKNYIKDSRTTLSQTLDGSNAAIYSKIDLKIKGKGLLSVDATYNNGIGTKDDLTIKNAEVAVIAPNNAIKGSDSITIESGTITAISTLGDALKTSNSSISSKGKQKGDITILDGVLNLYSACDAIDASYNVNIGGDANPIINIFTEKYSEYSQDVSITSETTMYLGIASSGRNGKVIDTNTHYFGVNFTLDDSTTQFVKMSSVSSSSGGGPGGNNTTYYSVKKPSNAVKLKFFAFENSQTQMSTETYKYASENMSIPSSQDAYKVSSVSGSTMNGSWTNYTTSSGGWGGPGGMNDGNPDSATYSCKGIKADNFIQIDSGNILIKSHDDAIHANNDTLLETNTYGVGNVTINGGYIDITCEDDGVHADNILNITGGTTKVNKSYEGLEAPTINISGGTNVVFASDDGINASGNNGQINFTGGFSYFNANGDVIDANGSIMMSGGVVFAMGPSSGGNGLLDFDRTFTMTGGFLFGFGGADMAQRPTASGVTLAYNSNTSISQNNYVNVMEGNSLVASMRVTMSNLRYYVLGYESSYGSGLAISSSTTSSVELIDNLYYFAK